MILATALFFKENSQEDFGFVSFDVAAKQLAAKCRIKKSGVNSQTLIGLRKVNGIKFSEENRQSGPCAGEDVAIRNL